jgi:hypothetical protein
MLFKTYRASHCMTCMRANTFRCPCLCTLGMEAANHLQFPTNYLGLLSDVYPNSHARKDHSEPNAAPTEAPNSTLGSTLRVIIPVTAAETITVPIEITSGQTKRLVSTLYPIHKTFLFDIVFKLMTSKALLSWNNLPLSCRVSGRKNPVDRAWCSTMFSN